MSNLPSSSISARSAGIVATAKNGSTTANSDLSFNLLNDDYDLSGYAMTVTALNTKGTKGTVTLGTNGAAVYTPGSAFAYLAAGTKATDTFTYTVSDAFGGVATATTTVTVVGTWKPPAAKADTAATKAGQSVAIDVLANDTDPQPGQTLKVSALNVAGTQGTAAINTDGTVTYTPSKSVMVLKAGAIATDSFAYTVSDGHGSSSTTTVTVTITGVNTPPVAKNDTAATTSPKTVWIGLANNDTDLNGDSLTVTAVNTAGTKGSVSLNPNATNGANYTPGTAFAYLAAGATATDSFTYTVSDGHGGTATATATVTITGVDTSPVAKADTATTTASQGVWIGLANNDTDPFNYTLNVTGLNTAGTKGSVSLNPNATNGAFYTPGTAFAGLSAGETATDSFTYTVSNGHGGTATSTATVTVSGVNKAPVVTNQTATTDASHAITVNVLAGATDANLHDVLSVTSLNLKSTAGSATLNANGTVTYTPAASFAGLASGKVATDQFSYTVSDGHGGTASATANIIVTAATATTATATTVTATAATVTSAPAYSATVPAITSSVNAVAAVPATTTIPTALVPNAIYVATNGNDRWSGTLAAPNAAGTDGPLATLAAAQGVMERSSTIRTAYIEGGTYNLTKTLNLGSEDSGQSWIAMPGQTPVITGGQTVTGWVKGANGIWTATAPAGAFTQGGAIADLFVNGTRETHARYPNAVPTDPVQGGWLSAAASLPGQNTTRSFQFGAGDIPTFSNTSGLYVAVYQQNGWQSFTLPVSSINYDTRTINLGGSTDWAIDAGSRYYVYNAASQLDTPGEWFYNAATNQISLYAPTGFDGTGVTVGSLNDIVTISGAKNVTLSGLTITGSTSTGTGINVTRSSNVTLNGNTVSNVGTGINLDTSGGNDLIQNNTVQNTGADGILIAPGVNNVTVTGNTIRNIGQLTNGSGIWFTGSSNDVITRNTISNTAHFGIGGGSVLGKADASYNNLISANTISNANQASSDGGGIYLIGMQQDATGDVISYNTIYGTTAAGTAKTPELSFMAPSQLFSYGIYLDDFASGVSVKGNILYNNLGGIDVHSGWDNQITGNVIVNSSVNALYNQASNWRGTGVHASTGNVFSGNVVANSQPGATMVVNEAAVGAATWAGNFYEAAGLSSSAFVGPSSNGSFRAQSFTAWQAGGADTGSVVGTLGVTPGTSSLAGIVPTTVGW